eukprot:snap_masked-scaffold_12-processed-gene-5.46-mRNA-1 protein AED:1.00 eAED:1.00 QI:0/-1/0/0/-1/1/1/0/394
MANKKEYELICVGLLPEQISLDTLVSHNLKQELILITDSLEAFEKNVGSSEHFNKTTTSYYLFLSEEIFCDNSNLLYPYVTKLNVFVVVCPTDIEQLRTQKKMELLTSHVDAIYPDIPSFVLSETFGKLHLNQHYSENDQQLECAVCKLEVSTDENLLLHANLFHNARIVPVSTCSICEREGNAVTQRSFKRGFTHHLEQKHDPNRPNSHPSWLVSYAIVTRVVDNVTQYLLVAEVARNGKLSQLFLPAGKVDEGEDFLIAAKRECLEEAGVGFEIEGLIGFLDNCRIGVFQGTTKDVEKRIPDYESLAGCWTSAQELREMSKKFLRDSFFRNLILMIDQQDVEIHKFDEMTKVQKQSFDDFNKVAQKSSSLDVLERSKAWKTLKKKLPNLYYN